MVLPRLTRQRTFVAITTVAAFAASIGLYAASTQAAHSIATLPGSSFEIDDDANLKVDDALDWANVDETIGIDLATGQDDNSYKGGTKEDTECPDEVTGSIPNNKSDLLTFHAHTEDAGDGFLNLAWSRVSDPSGTTLMDFELNQSDVPCPQGPNLERTDGDALVEYAIDQGGARASIDIRYWDAAAGAWGDPADLTANNPICGGNPCAAGTINSSLIPQAESEELAADKQARTFGEMQIDLRYLFANNAGKCTSFGSAIVKSRASDSFTSQIKDFISPIGIDVDNCATVIIRKETIPEGSDADFGFTTTTPDGSFTLSHGESNTETDVLFGTYSVAEGNLPSGWVLDSVDCSASTNVTPTVSGAAVTFTVSDPSDVVDCTYTNRAQASLTFEKDADFDGVDFDFTGINVADFSLADGDSVTYSDLTPGDYGATETVPVGWVLESMDCDNGDTADDVTLAAGDDVTCTFVNRIRGDVTFVKVAERDGVDFDFTGVNVADFSLANGESQPYTGLAAGTYGATETVPAGWNLQSATCDNGDPVDAVVIDTPAESVTCTFTNVIERGAVVIQKNRKHAADGPGDHPHAGVDFTVTNANGTNVTVATDANGYACVENLPVSVLDGDYAVTETLPGGYANPTLVQTATVVEGGCGAATPTVFTNTPLTNVTISVDSQVDGGTASVMECTSALGTVTANTESNGDGSITVTDLLPTDPAVTITCTVIVDP